MTTKSKEQKSASNCNTIPTINERLGELDEIFIFRY